MQQLKDSSDRELVTIIKLSGSPSAQTQALEVLYNRYTPLINKYYYKMIKVIQYDRDEFFQEAYISLANCVDHVNLDIIYDDNWSFYTKFIYYIRNLRNYTTSDLIEKSSNETSYQGLFDKGNDAVDVEGTIVLIDERVYHSSEMLDKISAVRSLGTKLSDVENQVANYIADGYATIDIMDITGLTYHQVYRVRDKIKVLLKES